MKTVVCGPLLGIRSTLFFDVTLNVVRWVDARMCRIQTSGRFGLTSFVDLFILPDGRFVHYLQLR
jgi:poly-beta-hydroxyalkanoate depolymerase